MNRKAELLTQTFHDFWSTWAARKAGAATIEAIVPFFDPQITAIGSGDHEKGRSFEEVVRNFRDDFLELETAISIDFFREETKLIAEEVGLVEAEAYVFVPLDDDDELKFHLRFSTVFTCREGGWKIVHNHVSIPNDGQAVGEAFPLDKLKAQNTRLEAKVQEQTREIAQRNLQLREEKKKKEELLHNILPELVADELIEQGRVAPSKFEQVSVLFSDFVGFTQIAASISAEEIVEELNDIFFFFDDIMQSVGMEKIKTIGDSYMAVGGMPQADPLHAQKSIVAAQRMLAFLEKRNKTHPIKWQMRVGIHSGPVVAGVVGNHKFTYDLWGNTVNIASRLEGASQAGRINISSQTYQLVKEQFSCEPRGEIAVKGGIMVNMYFVD